MRMLIISSEFPPGPGGIATHAYQLALRMTRLGWLVTVLTSQDYSEDDQIRIFNSQQEFQIVRFKPKRFSLSRGISRFRMMVSWLWNWKPDLVVATGLRSVWLTSFASLARRLNWVAIGHGTEFGATSKWVKALVRWAFLRASAVICVSNFTWMRMRKCGIHPKTGRVIPNGADSNQFFVLPKPEVDDFRNDLHLSESHLMLTVGNVTERKAQDVVIRALPTILKQLPNTHYLIVGLPSKRESFEKLAQELNVKEHVHFVGKVEQEKLIRFLNCCDVFVMTSRNTKDGDFEGYGIAVVEAALCQKPAVVSANSGLAEAVIDGETGFVVPEDDHEAVADRVLLLLMDKVRSKQMARAAFIRATETQTWDQRASEYNKFFASLIQGNPPKSIQEVANQSGLIR